MTEREVNEMARCEMDRQLQPQPTKIDIPVDLARNKPRDTRKLRWYERQYGAGFVSGFWVGVMAGLPIAMGLAAVCKWFTDWLFLVS